MTRCKTTISQTEHKSFKKRSSGNCYSAFNFYAKLFTRSKKKTFILQMGRLGALLCRYITTNAKKIITK